MFRGRLSRCRKEGQDTDEVPRRNTDIRFEKERDFSEGCATPVYAEKAGDRTVVVSGTNRVDFRLALKMDSDRNPWSMTGGQISGVAFLLRSQVASCDCSPTARQHQSKTLGSFALKLDDAVVGHCDA